MTEMETLRRADHGVWAEAMSGIEPRPVYQENVNPDRELTRWLFFPGNVIEPKRARELQHLRVGGIELDTVCLRRFKGVVPRLRFTPLEMAPEWMPVERIPEGVPSVAPPVIAMPTVFDEHSFNLLNMAKGRTPGVKVFPGDALTAILMTVNNDSRGRRGVVEITSLKGHLMEDSDLWQEAQMHYFDGAPYFAPNALEPILPPDWPLTINAVRQRIEQRRQMRAESVFQEIADQILASCDDFYWWGAKVISDGVTLSKTPFKDGFIMTLPPLVRLLSEQLDIPLEEDQLRLLGRAINDRPAATPAPVPVVTNETQQLIQMLMEERATMKKERGELQARLDAALANQPAPAETPATPNKQKNGNAR